jgi:nucleotide-binding universal stress UspA family protein
MQSTRKCPTVVMGSRGLGGIQGLLMGSVSHKVSHAAACSVVIVK